MEAEAIKEIVDRQREYFLTGETLSVDFRIKMLKDLQKTIQKYENEIALALKEDLGKGDYESYMCEIGLALSEIRYMLKHTKKFARGKRVRTPLAQFPSKSFQKPSPYGTVLIMSPWNYPFLLSIDPLVNAISAGNTAVVKPSAYSPQTSLIVEKIIKECFDEKYVAVVTGGRKENSSLLENKFDFIFFTGSQTVGKEVLVKASTHLTPVILELGGKSPCIVDQTADIKLSAKRIVFGKFLNVGQTCVAPDFVLCHKSIKEQLLNEIINQIKLQYGENPLNSDDYGKIINEKHFDRITGLINMDKVVYGGKTNKETLQIEPTVMSNVTFDDAVMQEEIFGPILPIIEYENIEEVVSILNKRPKPLAQYIFSKDKKAINYIVDKCSFGGGCINDTIIHLATSELGFGGVGESGMGAYHGKVGFDAFSHTKSIVDKKLWLDLPMRYKPYTSKLNKKLIRMFLK